MRTTRLSVAGLYFAVACLTATCPTTADAQGPQPTAERIAEAKRLEAMVKALHPITGDVPLPAAKAILHLGKAYYFLDAVEAKRVLTEAWGNPPEAVTDTLGSAST